jgi:hypothetical protein
MKSKNQDKHPDSWIADVPREDPPDEATKVNLGLQAPFSVLHSSIDPVLFRNQTTEIYYGRGRRGAEWALDPDLEEYSYEAILKDRETDPKNFVDPTLTGDSQMGGTSQGYIQQLQSEAAVKREEEVSIIRLTRIPSIFGQERHIDQPLADIFGEPYEGIVARVKAWCAYSDYLFAIASGRSVVDVPEKPEPHRGHFHSERELDAWFDRRTRKTKRDIAEYWVHPKRCSRPDGERICGRATSDGKQVYTCWVCRFGHEILKDALSHWPFLNARERDIFRGVERDQSNCLQDIRDAYARIITTVDKEIDQLEKPSVLTGEIDRGEKTMELVLKLQRLMAYEGREIEVGRAKGWTSPWTRNESLDVISESPEGYRCCLY